LGFSLFNECENKTKINIIPDRQVISLYGFSSDANKIYLRKARENGKVYGYGNLLIAMNSLKG